MQSAARAILAALVVSSFLFASLLAADQHLHRMAHADADHAEHQCLAVLLTQGLLDAPTLAPVLVAIMLALVGQLLQSWTVSLPSPHYRLLPGRAPPYSLA